MAKGIVSTNVSKSVTAFRLTLYPILRTTSEWNNFATTFQKNVLMQTPLFLHLFGLKVQHHHLGPQTHVIHSMPILVLYFTAHILLLLIWYLQCKKIQNELKTSLHEAVKIHQQSKVRNSSPQKLDSIGLT